MDRGTEKGTGRRAGHRVLLTLDGTTLLERVAGEGRLASGSVVVLGSSGRYGGLGQTAEVRA